MRGEKKMSMVDNKVLNPELVKNVDPDLQPTKKRIMGTLSYGASFMGGCVSIGTFSMGAGLVGALTVTQAIIAMAKQPAKAFGIYGRKGDIKVGFDADLLIVDPEKEWEITSDSLLYVNKISAFVGMKGKGHPVCTIVRGNVVAENGKITAEKGVGTFIAKLN